MCFYISIENLIKLFSKEIFFNILMEKFTYPIVFSLNAKRGNNYKERKIEIYKEHIKYIEPGKQSIYNLKF